MHKTRLLTLTAASLLISLASCASGEDAVELDREYGWIANGLSPDEFDNAVSANPAALATLRGSSLAALATHQPLARQLSDTDAQKFMQYVVSCALPQGVSVTFTDTTLGQAYTFDGWLGLHADWESNAPTVEGLRHVSGCVLARVNAYDVRVFVSVRGEPAALYGLGPNETSNFQVEEGSFYGDIFQLAPGINVYITPSYEKVVNLPPAPVDYYPNMWSCTNPAQMAQYVGYMNHRVCTAEGCVAQPLGSCDVRCSVQDGPEIAGDGDNDDCVDPNGVVWTEIVTTYMHASCAMVDPACP